MTRSSRSIAPHLFLSLCILSAGCQSASQPSPANKMVSNINAQSAAALQLLDRSSLVAEQAIKSIDIARDVVVNNLSNVETTAFKASRPILEEGGKIHTQLDFSQGSLINTGRPLDVGIQGTGFFKVQVLSTLGDGTAYTRNGNFFINDKGEIVVGMGDGYKLIPDIKIPTGISNITISTDGIITGIKPGGTMPTQIGQLKLTQFVNPDGLNLLGSGLFQETAASGPPINSRPGDQGSGSLLQNFLEGSNVNLTQEMIHLQYLNRWRATLMQAMGMQPDNI